jgi:DNA-binding SARP family transcriptional activator/ABC-type oligopeptide transport system substrate-binding subunit/DNA-binding beta-propeller fold protein YncE
VVTAVLFRILGDLEVVQDGRPVRLGSHQQRAVLAMLVLHVGEVVTVEHLIDGLWGDEPPATAGKVVQVYVSRLRHALAVDDIIGTRDRGYVLHADNGQVDLAIFEQTTEEGRTAFAAGDAERAASLLSDGLALWRGPPLAEFAAEPFGRHEIGRLEELRLAALELRIEADLAAGRHAAVVAELDRLTAEHPYRERLHGLQMLALYRCGRQSDALEAYRRTRALLVDELGLEPSGALRNLHEEILRQDPVLAAPAMEHPAARPAAPPPTATSRWHRRGAVALAALALAGGVTSVALVLGDRTEPAAAISVAPNSVAVIDADNRHLVTTVAVGVRPGPIAFWRGTAWVANLDDRSVTRIRLGDPRVLGTSAPGGYVSGLAATSDGVWVEDSTAGAARRLDPTTGAVTRTVRLRGRGAGPPQSVDAQGPAAARGSSLWLAQAGTVTHLYGPGRRRARIVVGDEPAGIAVGGGAAWVSDNVDNNLFRIVADSVVDRIPTGQGPEGIAIGAGAVWVAQRFDGTVARFDPDTGRPMGTIPVGNEPRAVAVIGDDVWVANSGDGTLSEIDARQGRVVHTVDTGGSPAALATDGRRLWVSVESATARISALGAGARGGVAHVDFGERLTSIDPALAYGGPTALPILYATCAKLYNYPDASGAAGMRTVPEVARGAPAVSRDGLRYRFTIRPGFRFSPPSGAPVTAAAFRRAIERMANPLWKGTETGAPAFYFDDIVGARAFRAGRARHIAGVTARGDLLTIALTRPVPDLPLRLSTTFFCAVPPDAPVRRGGVPDLPSAGPFYVKSVDGDRQVVIVRNPNYHGPRHTHLDAIDIRFGRERSDAIARVLDGRDDYDSDGGIPRGTQARLLRTYGDAGHENRPRFLLNRGVGVSYFVLNTSRPLFAHENLRRAVGFAIDRRTLDAQPWAAGFHPGLPASQDLAPGVPGYRDRRIYPTDGPDVERARRLAGPGRHRAVMLTCDNAPCPQWGAIVRHDLARIGIDVTVRRLPLAELFDRQAHRTDWDIGWLAWAPEYPDAAGVLNILLHGRNLPSRGGYNLARFDDPAYNRRLDAAAALTGPARTAAYARLDADLTGRAAPLIPFGVVALQDLFAARMGCEIFQPFYGIDLAALCVKSP